MDFLSQRHSEARYYYENPFRDLEGTYNTAKKNAALMTAIAGVLFGIMLFGFMGLLALIVNRRRTALAVSRMCGASTLRLAGELYCEVAAIVFSGVAAGIGAAVLFMPASVNGYVIMQNSWEAALLCVAGLFVVSVIVSGVGIFKVTRVSPVTALSAQ